MKNEYVQENEFGDYWEVGWIFVFLGLAMGVVCEISTSFMSYFSNALYTLPRSSFIGIVFGLGSGVYYAILMRVNRRLLPPSVYFTIHQLIIGLILSIPILAYCAIMPEGFWAIPHILATLFGFTAVMFIVHAEKGDVVDLIGLLATIMHALVRHPLETIRGNLDLKEICKR